MSEKIPTPSENREINSEDVKQLLDSVVPKVFYEMQDRMLAMEEEEIDEDNYYEKIHRDRQSFLARTSAAKMREKIENSLQSGDNISALAFLLLMKCEEEKYKKDINITILDKSIDKLANDSPLLEKHFNIPDDLKRWIEMRERSIRTLRYPSGMKPSQFQTEEYRLLDQLLVGNRSPEHIKKLQAVFKREMRMNADAILYTIGMMQGETDVREQLIHELQRLFDYHQLRLIAQKEF